MKKMSNVAEHIRDINCVIPGFHKTVKLLKNKDADSIYKAICSGAFLSKDNPIEYFKNS